MLLLLLWFTMFTMRIRGAEGVRSEEEEASRPEGPTEVAQCPEGPTEAAQCPEAPGEVAQCPEEPGEVARVFACSPALRVEAPSRRSRMRAPPPPAWRS